MGNIKGINDAIYSIADEETFFEFIQANMRTQPEEYAKIREINADLVEVDGRNRKSWTSARTNVPA
jgi:hypothetical protein